MIVVHEKCTRSSAATVDRRPRFHSNQPRVDQSIVRNASRSTDHHAGTRYLKMFTGFPFNGVLFFSFINKVMIIKMKF